MPKDGCPEPGTATIALVPVSTSILKLSIAPNSLDEVISMTRFAREPDPKELLPLKPIELLVLTMLSAGERHGYGLRQDIVAHTGGQIALEAGNLYRHIRRLQ